MELLKGGIKGRLFGLLAPLIFRATCSSGLIAIAEVDLGFGFHISRFISMTTAAGFFLVPLGAVLGIIYRMLKVTRNPKPSQEA